MILCICAYTRQNLLFQGTSGQSLEITPYQQLLEYMCATSTIWFIKHGVPWTMYVLFERTVFISFVLVLC